MHHKMTRLSCIEEEGRGGGGLAIISWVELRLVIHNSCWHCEPRPRSCSARVSSCSWHLPLYTLLYTTLHSTYHSVLEWSGVCDTVSRLKQNTAPQPSIMLNRDTDRMQGSLLPSHYTSVRHAALNRSIVNIDSNSNINKLVLVIKRNRRRKQLQHNPNKNQTGLNCLRCSVVLIQIFGKAIKSFVR